MVSVPVVMLNLCWPIRIPRSLDLMSPHSHYPPLPNLVMFPPLLQSLPVSYYSCSVFSVCRNTVFVSHPLEELYTLGPDVLFRHN